MHIWLIKEGEPLPCDEGEKILRVGMLAEELVAKGHNVVWWSSTFDHQRKMHRFKHDIELPLYEKGRLILLYSWITYNRNISPKRLIYHEILSYKFYKKAKDEAIPDIILCALPAIQFVSKAIKYGKKHGVPIVIDVRDMWPDIFEMALPRILRPLSKWLLYPLNIITKKAFIGATGIIGTNSAFVKWGLIKAGRNAGKYDKHFFIGCKKRELDKESRQAEFVNWKSMSVSKNTFNVCFFGTMSKSTLDLDTLIDAANSILVEYPDIRFVFCGDGDGLSKYKARAGKNKNIIFPGWIGWKKMQSLMEISKVGLYPYKNILNFKNNFSNKAIEYLSHSLPIISSLEGFSKDLILKNGIGAVYIEGNVESFIRIIKDLFNNKNKLEKMSLAAKQQFMRYFNANVVYPKIVDYLETLSNDYKKKADR